MKILFFPIALIAILLGCTQKMSTVTENQASADSTKKISTFQEDVEFLKKYIDVIVLQDASGNGKLAVSAALQGRAMTSTSEGNDGLSYGWINKELFISGDTSEHMNAYGGEDRIWLGPEGGQFSIYFNKGAEFNLDNWHVPRVIDLDTYTVASSTQNEAVFTKEAELRNYTGRIFNIGIKRTVKIIEKQNALNRLGLDSATDVSLVAFESINELINIGSEPWTKESGLLSIWILGMFNPSPAATIIVPYQGKETMLRNIVNDTYFGQVPDDRLKLVGKAVLFKADGAYRSKIGLTPENAPQWLGSYDADNNILTVVKYTKPTNATAYVNSLWEIQKEPYRGDAVNAYNDGPPAPGAKPLGPFYELETSSPAAALKPEESVIHVHTTFHIKGLRQQLDPIVQKLFNISIDEINGAF
ncbi:DUF6786 family protein [Chryseolinea sp. H1M3-3]|uniref:DUF6786 family protein n=1 Tax=Chryseolinea sp. H1M3-3 TaxID=3034144 RepID=UPI0023EA9E74|nr:DUF6786 family protein [Chryseolinea sp. H1M3-3]